MRDNTALIERVREGGQAGRKQNGGRKYGPCIQYCKTIFKSRI